MKALQLVALVVVVLLVCTAPVFAEGASEHGPGSSVFSGAGIGAGLGAGLIMIGAALGFGKIGAAALESMARQPEVAGKIQVGMIIIAALLEGATFFGLLICVIVGGKATW